jgi:hypothetical protein
MIFFIFIKFKNLALSIKKKHQMFEAENQKEYNAWMLYQAERTSWTSIHIMNVFVYDMDFWGERLNEMDNEWTEAEKWFLNERTKHPPLVDKFIPDKDDDIYISRRTIT